jgi:zinc protease
MRDKLFPVLFHNSRYAERLPIGKKAVLDTFTSDKPIRFYKDWYRPNLMSVVVVGDVDVSSMEKLVKKHFSKLANPTNERSRELYEVPAHDETLYSIASDPEATQTIIGMYLKKPSAEESKIGDYRRSIVEGLYIGMMNNRLEEYTQQEDPPFIFAYFTKGQLVRTSEYYFLAALVKENGIERGLDILLTETERVKLYGFNDSELDRQKKAILRSMEKAWLERDKIESSRLAAEYIRNFLFAEPLPGIDYEYKLYQHLVPGITIEEINTLAKDWTSATSKVITVESPEKEGVILPDKAGLEQLMNTVSAKTIEPYIDDVLDVPLVASIPERQQVIAESYHDSLGFTEWKLPNGARVIAKATDFKKDEIRFSATSPGGLSLYADSILIPAQTASNIISEGGLGEFNQIQLQKTLSGKVVRLSPYISEFTEGLSGQVSPKDMETLFQLIYLYFYSPRKDSTSFASLQSRFMAFYQNRSAQPETAWRDTITATITQGHPRFQPLTAESFEHMDLEESHKVFKDRFAEAGDFIFFFVGNFDKEILKKYVETYLASLPSIKRKENWKNVTYDYPKGVIEKWVKKGSEPKSQNAIIFTGDFDWNRENRFKSGAMIDILRIKLRERIREDLGGTYGVRVRESFPHIPKERYRITIEFGCDPERIEELTNEVFTQIDSLVRFGATESYLNKIKEADLRSYEKNIKENGFWISNLEFKLFHGEDPMDILTYPEMVDRLTLEDIQKAAQALLNKNNYVRVVLMPEAEVTSKE